MTGTTNILPYIWGLITGQATGAAYMYSEPRYTLSQKSNCVVAGYNTGFPLLADDAGNWTGCAPGAGNLVGTCRDWSACAESAKLGRAVTPEELYNLTFDDVALRVTEQFNGLGLNQLSDQDVANIVMHVSMHFGPGNMRVVQRALNDLGEQVEVDGILGDRSLEALKRQTRKNPKRMYNAIRNRLEESYSSAPSHYRTGFLSNMKHFPPKNENATPRWVWWIIITLAILLLAYIIYLLL